VGVMLVPQCLAFALLAGLPIQVGLYASFVPLVVYSLFGTIRQVQAGPTAVMSLLTAAALDSLKLESDAERMGGAAIIALFMGGIGVLLGLLRVGFIVDFMSHSVMTSFCSAAGVTIATSQMKHLFGIKMPRKKHWWETASYLVSHLDETHGPTFALGGTLLFMLLFLKYWKSAGSAAARKKHLVWRWMPTDKSSPVFRILKTTADLSALLAVVIGWIWALVYRETDVTGVRLVGPVGDVGIGGVLTMPGNGLKDIEYGPIIQNSFVMCIVGFLETMAVGGKFAMQAKYEFDADQELISMGLANVASGFMSGYPITGSFSRTAVNAMLGATSLVASFISPLMVLLTMCFLLPVIEYLPLCALAPIIIQGALGVISFKDFKTAFSASKSEFCVMTASFIVSLALTVKEGLLVGFVGAVLKTMNDLANPNLAVCGRLPDNSFRDIRNFPNAEILPNCVVVRMDARLSFANSRKLKEFCARAVKVRESQGAIIQYVMIDGKSINHIDLTGCEMLETLAESLKSRSQILIVANLKGPASKCLSRAGVPHHIKKQGGHLCMDMDSALSIIRGEDKDGQKSEKKMEELVSRLDSAEKVLKTSNSSILNRAMSGRPVHAPHSPRLASGNTQDWVAAIDKGEACPCGHFFMDDSLFCRKCGQKRKAKTAVDTSDVALVLQEASI